MDRISRQISNAKQNKIEVVKSQPSVNSLREGQEVIYISKSNRLERYRKEKGKLWTSYMYPTQDKTIDRDLIIGRDIVSKNKRIDPTKLGVFYQKIYDDDTTATLASSSTTFANTDNAKDMFEDDVEGILKVRFHDANTDITNPSDLTGSLRIHTGTDTTAYDAGDGTDSLQFMVDMQILTLTQNKDIHMQYKRQAGSASGTVTFSDINLIAILIGGS